MKDNNLKNYPCSIPEALIRFEYSDKTALICDSKTLTYKELIADAKKVAHALIAKGVKKGNRVIIEMPRSIDYVRIYLGIIFAGGIVVTIHTGWPEQQRNHVISDCSPVLIVDDIIAQELFSFQINDENLNCPLPDINEEDDFQIIYTSGSTGIPKGAVNCHQVIINSCLLDYESDNDQSLQYFDNNCHCLLVDTNLAFIAATMMIFKALINGREVSLATDKELKTPKGIADCIRSSNVDQIGGTLSRYYKYLEEPEFSDALKGIRLINLTGETPIPKLLDTFCDYSNLEVFHFYGSSETGIIFSKRYRKGDDIAYSPAFSWVPIYLLDEKNNEVVSTGSVGEICVGGTAGKYGYYWNNPELTSEKYIEHPIYGRLFHTGDMARIEPDGNLKILGRSDEMAKLHGQRIELGAIEKAMEDFPGVRRAAVKIQGEGSEAVLCGYYCGTVDEGSFRRALAASLPYYMVPAILRELPELPLNINGKIDRRALPLIQYKTGQYTPPQTEMEKLLCEIFANVLKIQKPVGIDDSFFELGGDSIRGMAVSTSLRERGFEMKMEWLFAVPTARELAPMLLPLKIEKDNDETFWSLELTDDERQTIDSTFGLDNVEVVYPLLPEIKLWIQKEIPWWACYTFLIKSEFTVEELRRRLAASVQCHQILRSIFIRQETEKPLQVVLKKWEIPIFYVDLSHKALSEGKDGELSDSLIRYLVNLKQLYEEKPFSSTKVMFETGLVKISKNKSILIFFFSRLLLDGRGGIRIISEITGDVTPISDVCQYNRYLHNILSDSYREESRKIWEKVIANHPHLTELPISPSANRGRKTREFFPGKLLMEKAKKFCLNMHITIPALLSLTLGRVLMELCGKEEVGFISINSGRDVENAELTGMFATGIPIYINKVDTPATVQEQIVSAMSRPLPDMDDLGLNLDDSSSKYHVTLSMPFFQIHNQNTKEFELFNLNNLAFYRNIPLKPSPATLEKIIIVVTLVSYFNIYIEYDRQYIDDDFVKKLGGSLLTQLRSLIE